MKYFLLAIGLSFFLLVAPATATTWNLSDNFLSNGSSEQYGNYATKDVIASGSQYNTYNISGMSVSIDKATGDTSVKIRTGYYEGVGNTDYGDLFISSDNYSPNYVFNADSTAWEYAFSTSTRNIYSTSNGKFVSSTDIGKGFYNTNTGAWVDEHSAKKLWSNSSYR